VGLAVVLGVCSASWAQKKASNPLPADGATDVIAPVLRWTAGSTSAWSQVYLGATPDLGPAQLVAPKVVGPMRFYYSPAPFQAGVVYYWRVDEVEKDGVTIHTGDVWMFVGQPLTAFWPDPANGSNAGPLTPDLTWKEGLAAQKHQVYFGDSRDAVAAGDAAVNKGEFADPNYAPGTLEPLRTYFWRVDEIVATGGTVTGPVWSFTTVQPVDDFESYNDEENKGTRIYETWIDGWTNNNGSTVGHTDPPFAERTIVHGGLQSMPLDYNNVDPPFYSEAERTWDTAQDWTVNDVNTLVLYVRGRPTNSPAPVYVRLEDSTKHSATVVYPEPAVVTKTKWTEWRIPLTDFAGVNISRVKTMCLGVGDRDNPQPAGAGLLYVDDVRVVRSVQ
jgi:hypothetical protein